MPNRQAARSEPTSGQADVQDLADAFLVASRVLVGVAARSLQDLDNITVPQFRTLVVLDSHDGMSLNALAKVLRVNASSAMRMVDRLLAAGLVTREENPNNRREVVLDLTPQGVATVRKVTARRQRDINRIVERMSERQRRGLLAALRAFAEAAEEPFPQRRQPEVSPLGW